MTPRRDSLTSPGFVLLVRRKHVRAIDQGVRAALAGMQRCKNKVGPGFRGRMGE